MGLRDLFWPRRCCVCERALEQDEEDICPECFADLPLTYFWDWQDNPAYNRLLEKAPISAAACLFFFRKEVSYNHIMHGIKYYDRRLLGYRLGFALGLKLSQSAYFQDIDAVTAVPLHPFRHFRRGYNQASVIARGIADAMGLPYEDGLLRRLRFTRSQARLSAEKKSRNVSGAFGLNSAKAEKMTGRGVSHILLVDDTLTTGATLGECASVLCEKGNFKVSAASLAYAG